MSLRKRGSEAEPTYFGTRVGWQSGSTPLLKQFSHLLDPPMRIQTKWFGPHGVREVRSGLSQFCKQSCTNGSCRTEKNEIVFLKDGVTQAKICFGLFHICIAQAVRHLKLAASDGVRKRGTHVFANKYHLHRGDTKGESLSRSWHWLAATECNFDSSD
jgi:hypothetical protein